MSALISAEGVHVSFGALSVLAGVSLSVNPGEIVTIVGPNGSGKSTLLRALIGAETIQSGTVTKKPNLRMGYVPQRLHVDQNLPLKVSRFLGLPHKHSAAEIKTALEQAEAENILDKQLAELSGGQLQRALLARALLNNPELVILDEPTQGLDQPGSARFYKLLESLRGDLGCGILMVSHELHVVMAGSDRVICLNGHICCEGAPAQVANAPEYRALFGSGTGGALALYRHEHDHAHDHDHDHEHDHDHDHDHGHSH